MRGGRGGLAQSHLAMHCAPLDLILKSKVRQAPPAVTGTACDKPPLGQVLGADVIGGHWSLHHHEFLAFLACESPRSLALGSQGPGANPAMPVVAARPPPISPLLLILSYFPLASDSPPFLPGVSPFITLRDSLFSQDPLLTTISH